MLIKQYLNTYNSLYTIYQKLENWIWIKIVILKYFCNLQSYRCIQQQISNSHIYNHVTHK